MITYRHHSPKSGIHSFFRNEPQNPVFIGGDLINRRVMGVTPG